MINLNNYRLENSIKARRIHYVPKRYLAGMLSLHTGEKPCSVFKIFEEVFNSNYPYRKGFDAFVEDTFYLDENKRIHSLKDEKYEGMHLSEDYPFTSSLNNGFRLIRGFLGVDSISDCPEEISKRLMHVRFSELADFLENKEKAINCGIDQNIFDYVVARECIANQESKNPQEIESEFFSLLIGGELLGTLFDNVKEENADRCLKTLRSLSLSTYDPRYEITSL